MHARRLASFIGLAQSSSLAIPLARAWLRSLHDDLSTRCGWGGRVRLCRQSLSDLRQWMRLRDSRFVGRSIWRAPETRVLHCDAGPYGWGAQLDHGRSEVPAAGFWQPWEAAIHITWRELRTVRHAVSLWCEQLRGRHVLLHEDNSAVVAILTSLTSRSALLMREVRALLAVLDLFDVELRAVWIASAANFVADHFSRLARPLDYSISRSVFDQAAEMWGAPTVDAFASPATALAIRWWSAAREPLAEACDAFAQQWEGERVWAHPPPSILPRLAQFLRSFFARRQEQRRPCARLTGRARCGTPSCSPWPTSTLSFPRAPCGEWRQTRQHDSSRGRSSYSTSHCDSSGIIFSGRHVTSADLSNGTPSSLNC